MEDDIEKVKNASSQSELVDNFRMFGKNTSELVNQAAKRQGELKDPRLRDDLASARAVLKKNSMMLLTASKVSVTVCPGGYYPLFLFKHFTSVFRRYLSNICLYFNI